MSMRHKFISPRLDVTFKKFNQVSPPEQRGPISPIRRHWANFVDRFSYDMRVYFDHQVDIEEAVVWQIDDKLINRFIDYDVIYVPHRQRVEFSNCPLQVIFYQQTVFPNVFSTDANGWGSSMTWIDNLDLESTLTDEETSLWYKYYNRAMDNGSKFEQPKRVDVHFDDFILFVCQIPHDETFKWHSAVSAEEALTATLEYAKSKNKKVIVKGHPANPSAMATQKRITSKFDNAIYVDSFSIHDLLAKCNSVFLVNSGVGFEAMFHGKKIIRFGDAEYRNVVPLSALSAESIDKRFDDEVPIAKYKKFISRFIAHCYQT